MNKQISISHEKLDFVSLWTKRIKFVTEYKNLFIFFVQVAMFCGVFDVSFGYSLLISLFSFAFMILIAYLLDKMGLRKRERKADFEDNDAWKELDKKVTAIYGVIIKDN